MKAEPQAGQPPPLLPGAVGLTHLRVYDTAAPADGLPGGSPHLHLACTEAYYVTAGRGEVQTLSAAEGFRTLPDVPAAPRSEQGVADDFYRYATGGAEPGISGRNNLDTLAVCEMLVRSARERRPVERAELV